MTYNLFSNIELVKRTLKFLLLPHYADQSIPMRTQAAEIFGKYLAKKHEVISIIKDNSESSHFIWENVECYNLPLFKFLKKIFELVNSKKFDIVFIRDDLFLLIIGLVIKKLFHIPILFYFSIPIKFIAEFGRKWYHPRNIGGSIKHFLLIRLMRYVDLVLPASEWMGRYLIFNGINKDRIYNFPNGANLDTFHTSPYPLSNKTPTYIYIGAIGKLRSLDIIIKAMIIVTQVYKEAILYMVGDGDDLQGLKQLTKDLKLEKNVIFTGLVKYEKVADYIEKSHICLCPIPPFYHYKLSSPLKLFEYMSCQRPVIANKEIPAHISTIRKSNCGVAVKFTAEDFAKEMIEMIKHPNQAREMGINGRKWIEENRSYKILADNLEKEIYKRFYNS